MSTPWVQVYTKSLCQYHKSMSIPWVHVHTKIPCQFHASMSTPWDFSDNMSQYLYHEIQMTKKCYLPLFWHQRKQKYWCYYPHQSRDSVCPVCGIFKTSAFLPPLPKVRCPLFLEICNPWGKVMERSGLRISKKKSLITGVKLENFGLINH